MSRQADGSDRRGPGGRARQLQRVAHTELHQSGPDARLLQRVFQQVPFYHKLYTAGITTAAGLARCSEALARKHLGGVVGAWLVREL